MFILTDRVSYGLILCFNRHLGERTKLLRQYKTLGVYSLPTHWPAMHDNFDKLLNQPKGLLLQVDWIKPLKFMLSPFMHYLCIRMNHTDSRGYSDFFLKRNRKSCIPLHHMYAASRDNWRSGEHPFIKWCVIIPNNLGMQLSFMISIFYFWQCFCPFLISHQIQFYWWNVPDRWQ